MDETLGMNVVVGWLRAEDQTVLSLNDRVVLSPRYSVNLDTPSTWQLRIRPLRAEDRGCYMCQINTQPSMKWQIGCIDVYVPPDIINEETSADVSAQELDNVTLICRASGHPPPKITWRREDHEPMLLKKIGNRDFYKVDSYTGSSLHLWRVDRRQMGAFLCIAANDVPPAVSKRIILNVNCHTQSESDLNSLQLSASFVNTNRNKRPRHTQSPGEEDHDLKQEIVALLNGWKSELDSKFNDMCARQNTLIAKISTEISELKTQTFKIKESNDEIVASMSFINKQYEEIKSGLDCLQKERLEQRKCLENLERKMQDLQLKSRSSSISMLDDRDFKCPVRNVPPKDKENSEDLTSTVSNIGQAVGIPISAKDLRDIYRLPVPPTVIVPNQLLGAPLGTDVVLECTIEAYPNTINYWLKNRGEMLLDGPKYSISEERISYRAMMKLTIRHFSKSDIGTYNCVSTNSLGKSEGTLRLYEIKLYPSSQSAEVNIGGLTEGAVKQKSHNTCSHAFIRTVDLVALLILRVLM
ncbi:unnamed protein product [Arctia plantaginis]|uniref:Ig-like domain-containing protein n=1 Tax=Arctia plantaginis TaxID=874455 RepID=A0A8S1B5Z3_ARCPL|nr:unnamed protein product [Arctia plantaginis]